MIDPRLRAFSILAHVVDSRRKVYRWLALGFYPPDADLVRALAAGQFVGKIQAATTWLGHDQDSLLENLRELRPGTTLDELELVYNRLFGKSIERVAAREAAYRWRDAGSLNPASDALRRRLHQQYQQFNAVPTPGEEDHVAVELEFLSYLCEREAANWASGAGDAARALRRQQRTFLDDHLPVERREPG